MTPAFVNVEGGERFTLSEEAVGSVNYIAPEMESGQHHLDPPTDRTNVYSLGKVLFWMVSGGRIFSREDHRAPHNYLVTLLRDVRFEHVHWLLDFIVVQNPTARRHMDTIDQGLELLNRLVTGNFVPLRPSVEIPCRFCGLGTYQRLRQSVGGQFPRVGVSPVAGSQVRVMSCSNRGHIEWFNFVGIQDNTWQEK